MLSNNPIHKQQSSQQQGVESEILQTRLQNLYGDVCSITDAGRLQGRGFGARFLLYYW